ncbi:MAG: hypothetical protein ACR2MK_03900 [Solirubrobacteraceae bacterium]
MAMTPPSTVDSQPSLSRRSSANGMRPRPRVGMRGGPDGNEQLTAWAGVILLVLLAVLGVTIVRIGQLLSLHLFLGLLLIGPVALKMASTGYRFVRYYTRNPAYRRKGAPEMWLRMIAPVVVLSTIGVFLSGVLLLFDGPADRNPLVLIHKVTFFAWLAVTGLHVLGHLPGLPAALRAGSPQRSRWPEQDPGGAAGRAIAIAGVLVGGAVLAVVLIPDFGVWTAHGALFHHHHQG